MKKMPTRLKVILGILIGFNIIGLIVFLVWIMFHLNSALESIGL